MKKGIEILIADTEVKAAELLRLHLTQEGYMTTVTQNGKNTLDIFKKHDISLLILDLALPDMTGEDICRIIREQSSLPIIITSGSTGENDCINWLNLGADDYFTKPVKPKIIAAKVNALLRRTYQEET